MEKILTIAVPAYNAAACLPKCLDSFLDGQSLGRLDIIVVNDGSTDNTANVAGDYAGRFPESVRVLDKANGGHGSAINAAIDLAAGRYFKVVDADDWVVTANLPRLLDILSETDADAVLADFQTVDKTTGYRQAFRTVGVTAGLPLSLGQLMAAGRAALTCATFHGIIYSTGFYRQSGIRLSEKIFFEDHEYATLPFRQLRIILPLDFFFYEYQVGDASQSVSEQSQVRRIGQIEQVFRTIQGDLDRHPDMPEAARRFYQHKLADLLLSYYVTALIRNPDRRAGRRDARRLRGDVRTSNPPLARQTDGRYRTIALMNRLHIANRTLERAKRSFLYMTLYRAIRRR